MNGTNCQNRIDKGRLYIDNKIVGLSISQWLPCPFAIWNLLFWMAILLYLVKLSVVTHQTDVMPPNLIFIYQKSNSEHLSCRQTYNLCLRMCKQN